MMKLDYSSLLSPNPIPLSIGIKNKNIHLRKPKLKEIDKEITLQQFFLYEMFLTMTPELYYTKVLGEQGCILWDSFSNEEKNELTLYKCVIKDKNLQDNFIKVFNFFFEETVIYVDGFFIFIGSENPIENINNDSIYGIVQEKNFNEFLYIIQQTCGIYRKENNENVKFKNALARKLYEKMQKANAENEKKREKELDKNLSLANIISKVSNKHPTISPITVWDLTLFQLLDSFKSMQVNESYDISKTRVSVWGDEKNTFDGSLWYRNNHEN